MLFIAYNTQCILSPAYVPIFFLGYEFTTAGEGIPIIEIDVYINDDLYQSYPMVPDSVTNSFADIQTSTYQIDISEVVQNWFDNQRQIFDQEIGTDYVNLNGISYQAEVYIKTTSWIPNDAGQLIPEREQAESQKIQVINAYRWPHEPQCLDAYVTGIDQPYLTRKPNKRTICINESETVGIYNSFINLLWKITSYDSDGNMLNEGAVITMTGQYETNIFGIGPGSINSAESSQWIGGNTVPIDRNVSYYDVQAVHLEIEDGELVFVPMSDPIRMFLNHNCCTKYRLHFLNSFGIYDSISIGFKDNDRINVLSNQYEQTRPLFYETAFGYSPGQTILYKQGTQSFLASTKNLQNDQIGFITDLINSPAVYLELNSFWIPVTVVDKTHLVNTDSQDYLVIECNYSNSIFSQRN